MKIRKVICYVIALFMMSSISIAQIVLDSIHDGSGYTYIASPTGQGPFPAVLYNHGGLGTALGGDLRGTVIALAKAGYLARAEKRMETVSLAGHLEEVETALHALRADPRADTSCVSMIGFSRGGLLTLEAAKSQANKLHAVVLMAPASGKGKLASAFANVSSINDPVLVLVAENDSFQDDHVGLAQMAYNTLKKAGKNVKLLVYPAYDSTKNSKIDKNDDGHKLFFMVQNAYWKDVIQFLNENCQ